MLDCLLISFPLLRIEFPPLGPAILNGVALDNGYKSKCRDLNIEFMDEMDSETIQEFPVFAEDGTYYNSTLTRKLIRWARKKALAIVEENPRWVCMSLLAFTQQKICRIICSELKRINPDIQIAVGGNGVSSHKQDPYANDMIKNKIADAVIFGEGEQIIKDILADKIWGLHRVDQLKLEEWQYSYPNYDDFDLSRYTERQDQPSLGITGSKGCVRRCTFCDVVSLWPKYNFRTGKDVAQELITNYERYGIKRFQFSDSLMNGSITAFREMNEEIVARIPNKITYVGQYIFRPKKHVKEHDYDMMKKAGAHEFFIGVESGSERVRDHMKKKFSNDDIDFTARCLGERGIKQRWLFILGYPTETEEDFEDTISLLRRFGYLARQGLLNLAVRIYYNYPGAPLYDELAFHNIADAINPYFWTAEINPDMDFEARYQRLRKYINVAIQEGYFTGDDDEDIVNVLAEYNRARERYWQLKNAS